MKKFTVQIKLEVVMSKEVKADSMEEALQIAKQLAKSQSGARAEQGWEYQWCEKAEVQGVHAP